MAHKYIIFECLFLHLNGVDTVWAFSQNTLLFMRNYSNLKNYLGDGYPKYSAGLADIALPWDTVRFINVHLSSTGVSDGDMSVEPNADDVIMRTKDIINKLIRSERARGLQAKSILQWVEESPHPLVLCGDFNSVPSGNLYARLLQKMEDPYIWHGTGKMGSFEPLKRRFFAYSNRLDITFRGFSMYGSAH